MKDVFGRKIETGDEAVHFFPAGGRAKAIRVRITGFTPKRVRFEGVAEAAIKGTAIPEQFAIMPEGALDYAPERPEAEA